LRAKAKQASRFGKKNIHADASLTADCRIKSGNDE
jgi:hypothetical protein